MINAFAIQLGAPGGAQTLHQTELKIATPARGEVRIRHTAIGVNFVDIYHRTGRYPLASLPAILGVEAAGIVEMLGEGVGELHIGQRVVYAGVLGGYSTARNIAADKLIALPDDVSDEAAASALLRGITAHMLFHSVRELRAKDLVLVHAAAGGLGQVLGQWQRPEGVQFIGTAGSKQKAEVALRKGYQHVIEYNQQDFVQAVKELSHGQGVHFAIDGIGGATLRKTLQTVRPFGTLASVGQAAGEGQILRIEEMKPELSISLSCPGVFKFMQNPVAYREGAQATLQHLQNGLKIDVSLRLPLHQAAEAHQQLESGATSGAVLLIP